jgi:hypothetical protein
VLAYLQKWGGTCAAKPYHSSEDARKNDQFFRLQRLRYYSGMTANNENSPRRPLRNSMLLLVATVLFLAVIMFVPAGIGWRRGWLFLLVFCAFTVFSSAYLWRFNPDIFVARSKIHEGTKSWDKLLMVPILVSFFAIFGAGSTKGRWRIQSEPPPAAPLTPISKRVSGE